MVSAEKEKVLLLVDNFSKHQVPNVGSRLEFCLQIQLVVSSL